MWHVLVSVEPRVITCMIYAWVGPSLVCCPFSQGVCVFSYFVSACGYVSCRIVSFVGFLSLLLQELLAITLLLLCGFLFVVSLLPYCFVKKRLHNWIAHSVVKRHTCRIGPCSGSRYWEGCHARVGEGWWRLGLFAFLSKGVLLVTRWYTTWPDTWISQALQMFKCLVRWYMTS